MQRRQEWQSCSQNNISPIIDVDALDERALKNSIMVKTSSATNCSVNTTKIILQSTMSSSSVSNIAENNLKSHPEHFNVSSFLTGYNSNATLSPSSTKPKEARRRDRAYSQPFLTIEHNPIPRPRLPLSQPYRLKTQNLSPSRMALVQMQDAPRQDTLMLEYRKPGNPARLIAEQRRNNTIPLLSNAARPVMHAPHLPKPMHTSLHSQSSNNFPSETHSVTGMGHATTYASPIPQPIIPKMSSVTQNPSLNQLRLHENPAIPYTPQNSVNTYKFIEYSPKFTSSNRTPIASLSNHLPHDRSITMSPAFVNGIRPIANRFSSNHPELRMKHPPTDQMTARSQLSTMTAEEAENMAARLQVQKIELENRIHSLKVLEKQLHASPQFCKRRLSTQAEVRQEPMLLHRPANDVEKRKLNKTFSEYESESKVVRISHSQSLLNNRVREIHLLPNEIQKAGRIPDEKCVHCRKKSYFVCSGCRSVWYCSKNCQVRKTKFVSTRLHHSSNIYFLVASFDLLIFYEKCFSVWMKSSVRMFLFLEFLCFVSKIYAST